MTPARTVSTATIAFILLLVLTHTVLSVMSSRQTNDDAFISFRYARNLAEGNGLVFNPGERVEGYTNFLWVMILSVFIPFFDPVPVSKILGVACNAALIVSIGLFCRRHLGKLAWIPPLYVALDPAVIRWGTRGLETSLFTLLLWLAVAIAVSENFSDAAAGGIAAAATLARPEGFLAAVVIFIARTLEFPIQRAVKPSNIRTMMRSVCRHAGYWLGYGVLIVPYLAWKMVYYGNVLPNTFYAKTGGGIFKIWRGIAYLTQGGSWPELILAAGLVAGLFLQRTTAAVRTVSMVGLTFVLYTVWVGGDSLGPDRFLAPIVPLLIVPAVAVTRHLMDTPGHRTRRHVAGILLAGILIGNTLPLRSMVRPDAVYSAAEEAAHPRTRLGKCLAEHANPGDTVATSLIGRTPYYSRLRTLDVFGLIDPHIARQTKHGAGAGAAGHEKTDIAYILSRRPDWIIANELVVMPPREHGWLRALRQAISGDPPAAPMGLLTPPFKGYVRTDIHCSDYHGRLWTPVRSNQRVEAPQPADLQQ